LNLKWIAIGTGVLLLATGAGFYGKNMGSWSAGPTDRVGQPVLQEVNLEQVGKVVIQDGEHEVTLVDAGNGLVVKQQYDFPADSTKLNRLLLSLMNQKIDHKVTTNPKNFGDLGVLTVEENGGKPEDFKTARVISLFDKGGQQLFGLLVGKDRLTSGFPPRAAGGQYVRYQGEDAVYLIPSMLTIDTEPPEWLDRAIFDLEQEKDIHTIRLRRSDRAPLVFRREKPEEKLKLEGVPDDQLNEAEVRDFAQRIVDMNLLKIAAPGRSAKDLGREKVGIVEVDTFDKRRYTIKIGEREVDKEHRYVTVKADLLPGVTDEKLKRTVQVFNDRFNGRDLGIYYWVGGRILKERKDFIKKPEKKDQ